MGFDCVKNNGSLPEIKGIMKTIYLPILMYHGISSGRQDESYSVSLNDFEQQMAYLHKHGYRAVVPEDLLNAAAVPAKPVMITFDDGYETDYTEALPVLAQYGFKGVSFLTTGFIGKKGYLSWEQVKKLKSAGSSIQSHTHSHPLLNTLRKEEIERELTVSKNNIEKNAGCEVIALSLPGGSFGGKIRECALRSGYRILFTSRPDVNRYREGNNIFSRSIITDKTSFEDFVKIVNGNANFYRKQKLGFLVKTCCKNIIGHERYLRLWKKLAKYKS